MKSDVNPMQRAQQSQRFTARSKRSGILCKNPVVRSWTVCRMHGADGDTSSGSQHPNYRHGVRTNLAQDIRRLASQLQSGAKDLT